MIPWTSALVVCGFRALAGRIMRRGQQERINLVMRFRQTMRTALSGEFMLPEGCVINEANDSMDRSCGVSNLISHAAHYSRVVRLLRPDDDLLDIGCGCGFALRVYRMVVDGRVVAVDKPQAIEAARMLYAAPGVEYVPIDLNQGRLPDGPFSFVTFTDVYEHLNDETGKDVINQIRERLTDDGKLVMSTPFGCEGPDVCPFHVRKFQTYSELADEVGVLLKPGQKVIVIRGRGIATERYGSWAECES